MDLNFSLKLHILNDFKHKNRLKETVEMFCIGSLSRLLLFLSFYGFALQFAIKVKGVCFSVSFFVGSGLIYLLRLFYFIVLSK